MRHLIGITSLVLAAILFFVYSMNLLRVLKFEEKGIQANGEVLNLTQAKSGGRHTGIRSFIHFKVTLQDGKIGTGACSELIPPSVYDSAKVGDHFSVIYLPDGLHDDGSGGFTIDDLLLKNSIEYVRWRFPALIAAVLLTFLGLAVLFLKKSGQSVTSL